MTPTKRVITVAPMPPEKSAYALARYSRSPDSIRASLDWVRGHDSQKFLESFYFQYGHASIADLGHTVTCFEGISELAASEIEDEPLWDGQAKSSRYQDFSRSGFITPAELALAGDDHVSNYRAAGEALLEAYGKVKELAFAHLSERYPRPDEMKPEAYRRNIAARAFDIARYLLFWGVPTNVGQVSSIRTLEKQIRRWKASPYSEMRALAEELAQACAAPPDCAWDGATSSEPLAPTLARHADADERLNNSRAALTLWASQNLPPASGEEPGRVDILKPAHTPSDIAATLLYPVTDRPFRELYQMACAWSAAMRAEVIELALGPEALRRGEFPPGFRGGLYAYDLTIDIGAWRDLHRHRRCHQFRQAFKGDLGFDTPPAVSDAGASEIYTTAMRDALDQMRRLPSPGAEYLLPFGARSRFLFKMDFAEAEYISRLRSGVKGHFSYRAIAWEMKQKMEELEPELGQLIEATPPWIEDPLKR